MLKKILNISIGFASIALEKTQGTVDNLVRNGKLSKEEGKAIIDSLIEELEEKKDSAGEQVEKIVNSIVNVVNKKNNSDEMESLKARVEMLENQIEALEAHKNVGQIIVKE